MTKRPSIIADLDAPPRPTSARAEPAPKRANRPGVQHTSIYIPRAAYERLREIAHVERCKIHDLLMQGIDRVIAERGHSERATRSTTTLQHDGTTE